MTLDYATLRPALQSGDFSRLFNHLGWDTFGKAQPIIVGGETFALKGVAHKRGAQVFLCPPGGDGLVPGRDIRARIDTALRKIAREHLVIFVDGHTPPRHQLWQWVEVEPDKPQRLSQDEWHYGHSGDRLIQKLDIIKVELDEENDVTLAGTVLPRLKEAFGRRDKVTKKFFDRFQLEQRSFLSFIQGVAAMGDREWYASVMLNRLMFVYFIQKKRFLDDDPDYLGTRLKRVQADRGKGQFHSFYKSFLRRLFHEGLGMPQGQRAADVDDLIGKVPYLNGGIFEQHKLEDQNPGIEIADEAFEKVFAFFDSYDWHLDERPSRDDTEINPDVLGYIFEKYINQKQMGAYYTKEDITGYITKNTVLPFLLERSRENCKVAFQLGGPVWSLLSNDPDRYIYPAVLKGVIDEDGNTFPLPAEIEPGVTDVAKRGGWNRGAPTPFALPTETWREHVARRQRCLELREKLRAGEVTEVNDLITHNLNIRQFAQDVIDQSEGPDVVKAFYDAMAGFEPARSDQQRIPALSVLDPTCGSGAFLFAALQILEPLYSACLDRMEAWLADEERLDRKHPGHRFRTVLEAVDKHPNREYFILKSIIINNLYGVDIMEEAVEICKVRLFLKLVSTVENADQVEPLPDVDFNIRAGNTLVGFTSLAAVRQAMSVDARGNRRLLFEEDEHELREIEESAASADRAFRLFRDQQTTYGGTVSGADKRALRERLSQLDEKLNNHLANQFGVDSANAPEYEAWSNTHQPLHWFVEFFGVMKAGGFDAVVGNPPYVEYSPATSPYRLRDLVTLPSGDLYAFVVERTYQLTRASSRVGFILPISAFGTDGFAPLQQLTMQTLSHVWVISYANRPAQLFDGAQKRLTTLVGRRGFGSGGTDVFSGQYLRWRREERDFLVDSRVIYSPVPVPFGVYGASLEKLGSSLEWSAFGKLLLRKRALATSIVREGGHRVYYMRKFGYFLTFLPFVPDVQAIASGERREPSELKEIALSSENLRDVAMAGLVSSTFFWFWNVLSDCRNLNRRDILAFPFDPVSMDGETCQRLSVLATSYAAQLEKTSRYMTKSGLRIQTFDFARAKPISDEIDRVLADLYGFTPEELDFIINYDIKYRMADDGDGGI